MILPTLTLESCGKTINIDWDNIELIELHGRSIYITSVNGTVITVNYGKADSLPCENDFKKDLKDAAARFDELVFYRNNYICYKLGIKDEDFQR